MAGDGDTFARIKELVERRGLAQRIHLLGFRTDIPNVLRGCDLFVLPTHQEALGQSFIEAMAAGLPVIGTHVDGVPELITTNVNGLLVPAKDTRSVARGDRAADRRSGTARAAWRGGRAGLRNAASRSDGMADETVDFYRRSLSERERATA